MMMLTSIIFINTVMYLISLVELFKSKKERNENYEGMKKLDMK